jgi:MFS superfamily sulfate permease-like transporter
MVSQTNSSDKKISVNNDNLDWIALASLVVLILSLMILLFLHYAPQFVKDIDLAIVIISLSVMLITLPIHGRESRIVKLLSFFKKFNHLSIGAFERDIE